MSSPPRAEILAIKWIIAWILQDQQSIVQSQQNTDDTALIELIIDIIETHRARSVADLAAFFQIFYTCSFKPSC